MHACDHAAANPLGKRQRATNERVSCAAKSKTKGAACWEPCRRVAKVSRPEAAVGGRAGQRAGAEAAVVI